MGLTGAIRLIYDVMSKSTLPREFDNDDNNFFLMKTNENIKKCVHESSFLYTINNLIVFYIFKENNENKI